MWLCLRGRGFVGWRLVLLLPEVRPEPGGSILHCRSGVPTTLRESLFGVLKLCLSLLRREQAPALQRPSPLGRATQPGG